MVDGDGLVDLDHHGVVHPDDPDEVSVAVRQVDGVDLFVDVIKLFCQSLSIWVRIHNTSFSS